MDSHYPATKEDLYHVQMDLKHVQSVQINHSDRISRLERRQADDAALKSVWGSGSPFPGILSGTPLQGELLEIVTCEATLTIVQGPFKTQPPTFSMILQMTMTSKETTF